MFRGSVSVYQDFQIDVMASGVLLRESEGE